MDPRSKQVAKMCKKILITGGTGLVGQSLREIKGEYPGREFVSVGSKDCNLVDMDSVASFIASVDPDAVIHLAAVAGGIGLSLKYPATLLRENVLMNLNVFEACRLHGVNKVVMSLSTGMYPASVPNPIREESIHDGPPHDSNYSYAFAKRLVEPMIRSYRAEYGMSVIGLVPNGIFGENNNYRHESSTMLAALIRRFYENRDSGSKIVVWGDGSPLREYTYARDVARAYMWCLDNYDDEQILHIGTTEERSVKEIALMIAELMGIDEGRIEFDTSRPSGQFKKSTDNSKFIKISGFKYTPFKEGLKSSVTWFCNNYNNPDRIRL